MKKNQDDDDEDLNDTNYDEVGELQPVDWSGCSCFPSHRTWSVLLNCESVGEKATILLISPAKHPCNVCMFQCNVPSLQVFAIYRWIDCLMLTPRSRIETNYI